ncbi:carbon-nitrogen hydrolase [Pseudoalteromonas piratica]|uniref:Acyltransferase n=1 Tax=Pseudoalteromonas piratica TaxID=1348114 RepID=A0A0A7EG12_9GAMM|nr:carbon-nitrogen hydrolase [Pseudoalteromonas piratica]AIY65493.1 acyltransferase [Pseudoalteromonas piratica]
MTQTIKVAAIQHSNSSDLNHNQDKTVLGIKEAAKNGAKLIVLQELHRSLYFCQVESTECFDLAEPIPGPSTTLYGQLAKELNVVIVTSLFEKRATGLYHNTAVVLDTDGEIAGTYRKMHIPDDPGFYEKFYFTPGDLGFQPIETSIGKLGVLVCWDQWFPEAARLMAMAGAEFLIYPTAIGWDLDDEQAEQQRQLDAWVIAQRAHAVSNGLPVIACNRQGHENDPSGQSKGIQFWGNSFITGPQGEILAHASNNDDEILYADIDRERSESVRRIWPYLRDRRIDHYQDLTKLYRD